METNNSCSGVCFWGFSPGVTDFDQAVRFLKTLNSRPFREKQDLYEDSYEYKDDTIFTSLSVSGVNGKIQNLSASVVGLQHPDVKGQDWLAFRPDNFLKANGVPKQVNVIMSGGVEGRLGYDVIFLYDQMYIRYTGNQVIIFPQTILHACPVVDRNIQRFDLWLGEYEKRIWNRGIDVTRISSYTADDIYQLLTGDPKQACFDLDYQRFLARK